MNISRDDTRSPEDCISAIEDLLVDIKKIADQPCSRLAAEHYQQAAQSLTMARNAISLAVFCEARERGNKVRGL